MWTHKNDQVPLDLTPENALQLLREGNFRFINNLSMNKDLLQMVNATKDGQFPFATILSCMDSRTSAELVFDQGLGDIFSIRIAGNVITEEILGSLEYATIAAGSKLIVVLGHSNCGAIKGACDRVQMGNLTTLLDKIQPAVELETSVKENRNSHNADFVEAVAHLNVQYSVNLILLESPLIRQMVLENKVLIAPAMYDVATGKVRFMETTMAPHLIKEHHEMKEAQ